MPGSLINIERRRGAGLGPGAFLPGFIDPRRDKAHTRTSTIAYSARYMRLKLTKGIWAKGVKLGIIRV